MTDADSSHAVLHYAACNDCDRYQWCDDERHAESEAGLHSDINDHDAYYDSTEVEL